MGDTYFRMIYRQAKKYPLCAYTLFYKNTNHLFAQNLKTIPASAEKQTQILS